MKSRQVSNIYSWTTKCWNTLGLKWDQVRDTFMFSFSPRIDSDNIFPVWSAGISYFHHHRGNHRARDIAQATLGRLSTTRHLYSLEISSCVAYVIGVRRDTTILSPTDALFRYTASVTPPLERMDAAAPHTHWDGQNSRVAPTKKISLPKVEFSGAHWYAQLYQKIIIIFADREPT